MNKKAECVRNVSNWSTPAQKYLFGSTSFDHDAMGKVMATASPKMEALFKKIEELDAADIKEHGTVFKHMIFTDIKASFFGARLLAAGFASKGYSHAYTNTFKLDAAKLAKQDEKKTFALLCSSTLYGKPLAVKFRKQLLETFNKRPDNTHGQLIRFIILDQGFKEGIDLYDIKYVHLFEPLITVADEKQAIGRGTRLCGQQGLRFDPEQGWPLHVIRYELSIPDELQYGYESSRLFETFLRFSGIDTRKFLFANTLESVCIFGAVDYELTKNVHDFSILGASTSKGVKSVLGVMSAGKKKKPKVRVNAPRKKKGFWQMREYIKERFGAKYTWPKAELENKCIGFNGGELVSFNETQNFTRMFFQPHSSYKGLMLWHSTGTGKCHALDTPILMYDGTIKKVQDVVVGDRLMGDDSTPRLVTSLARGDDDMFTVFAKDNSVGYTVNSEHILCLRDEATGCVREITVSDYLNLDDSLKHGLKGYRVAVDFPSRLTTIDPYTYAFMLNEYDDHIPREYLINDRYVRLQFLAGLIDRGRSLAIRVLNKTIVDDIMFLCRSLGLAAKQQADDDIVQVYGNDALDEIPLRFPFKVEYTYNALTYEIDVVHQGRGQYYGFTIDGNNRYLMGELSVTHNTCSAVAISSTSWERQGYNILWVTRHTLKPDIWKNLYKQVCSLIMKDKIRKGELPDDAYKKPLRYLSKQWLPPLSYKQFSNMLAGKNEFYNEMVRRNGADDLLKKTLVIIDEAHKLFAVDVPASERSDVKLIYKSILDSYEKSGKDSARVLLMTATPYTSDPMDLIKLINLMKPRTEHIPEEFSTFSDKYLDSKGDFTQEGKESFLDDVTGYISYLNREKDARQFSYPVYENVIVPMSTSQKRAKEDELRRLTTELQDIESDLSKGKEAVKAAKKKVKEETDALQKRCMELPPKARKACKADVATHAAKFEQALLGELSLKIRRDDARVKELKADVKIKKKEVRDVKADMSQQAALEDKCNILKP